MLQIFPHRVTVVITTDETESVTGCGSLPLAINNLQTNLEHMHLLMSSQWVEHEADLHTALALCLDVGEGQFLEKQNCNAPVTFCLQYEHVVILVEMKSDFMYMVFNIRFFSFLS
jgi:hypothetical protein